MNKFRYLLFISEDIKKTTNKRMPIIITITSSCCCLQDVLTDTFPSFLQRRHAPLQIAVVSCVFFFFITWNKKQYFFFASENKSLLKKIKIKKTTLIELFGWLVDSLRPEWSTTVCNNIILVMKMLKGIFISSQHRTYYLLI